MLFVAVRSPGFVAGRNTGAVVAVRRAVGAAIVVAVVLWLIMSSGAAQTLPERYAGVWVEGSCQDATRVRLVNSLAVIDVLDRGGEPHLQILAIRAAQADGDGVALTLAMANGASVDSRFALDGDRLNGDFRRCVAPPPVVAWTLGEVLTLFEAAGRIQARCRAGDGARCALEAFRTVDVSGDGVLRQAELARVFRAVGFFVGYAAAERNLVSARDMLVPSAIGGMVAPTVASRLVANYDYDGDGGLSLEELLQDRGDRAGLAAVLGSAEIVAADLSVDAAVEFMKTLAGPLLGSLPTP
jgi:hypothetical protein